MTKKYLKTKNVTFFENCRSKITRDSVKISKYKNKNCNKFLSVPQFKLNKSNSKEDKNVQMI